MFTMKYLIFVAFLLATANAFPFNVYKKDEHLVRLYKRATTFAPCPKGSPVPLNVTTDVDPTIGKTFVATVVFTTDKDYPKLFLTTTFTEDDTGKVIDPGTTTADLCAKAVGITCPVPKGQQVTLTAKTAVPDAAKIPYDIEFNVNDGTNTIGCSTAKIVTDGTGAPAPGGAAPAPGGGAPGGGAPPAPKGGAAPAPGGAPKGGAAPAPGGAPKGGAAPAPGGGAPGGGAPPAPGGGAPGGGAPPAPGGGAPGGGPAPSDGGPAPTDGGPAPTDGGAAPAPTDGGAGGGGGAGAGGN